MGRRMRPLDPASGPVERFACELRALRASAGDLPFWKMARHCSVSKSALAAAVAGHQLPSERVVREFVRVYGGDWPWWRERWLHARESLATEEAASRESPRRDQDGLAGDGVGSAGALVPVTLHLPVPLHRQRPARRDTASALAAIRARRGRRADRPRLVWVRLSLLVLAATVVSVFLTGMAPTLTTLTPHPGTSPARVSTSHSVHDGDDPQVDGCASPSDAEQAALGSTPHKFVEIADAAGRIIGDLGIWHNERCNADWAEASYTNPGLYKVTFTLHRPYDSAAVATEAIVSLPHDPVIGKLLRTDHGCVWADIKIDIPNSPPLTATTPCEI